MKRTEVIIFNYILTELMEQGIISEKFMAEIMKRLMLHNISEASLNHNLK